MTENRIMVTLSARDLLSPELGKIKSNIESLGAKARISIGLKDLKGMNPEEMTRLKSGIASFRDNLSSEASKVSEGSGGSGGFISAALFGSLGIGAVLAGISMISQGVQSAIGSVQSAAKLQTTGLAQAGDLASQLGVNFGKAKDLVAETRVEISKMAAALPGDNADYNAIFTQISATVAGTAKGDIKKYQDDVMELTKRFGVLASIRGVDANMGGSALNRVASGTMGIGEAFGVNDIFQKNPLLRKFVEDQLKIIGKSEADWKALTTESRVRILKAASKQAAADETLSSFDGTVDSMIQLANTSIFDQDTGLFGFLRKLKEVGGRSGLDAAQGAMTSFFTLIGTVGKIAESAGISVDPMMGVISVLDWFSDLSGTVNGVLNGNPIGDITGLFSNLSSGLFDLFSSTVDGLFTGLMSVDYHTSGDQVGFLVGQLFTRIFTRVDWGKLSAVLIRSLVGIGEFIIGFIVGAIKGNLTELGDAFHRLTDAALTWLDNSIKFFTKPIGAVKNAISDPVGSAVDITKSVIGWAGDRTREVLGGSKENVRPDLKPLIGAHKQFKIGDFDPWFKERLSGYGAPAPNVSRITNNSPVTPLEIPKTEKGSKQVSFNPSFTINAPAGTNTDGLVALIRNTINDDWNALKNNALV